ncbi:MAG: hypothetical protein JWM59_3959 [Verrucomicrobiales bacterium]|nr:hypothetical protein [Verrucomicrobiales bacterium]
MIPEIPSIPKEPDHCYSPGIMNATFIPAAGLLCSLAFPALAGNVILSPDGEIRTLPAARDAARASGKPARVIMKGGVYELDQPLLLEPADSGITWEAAPGEKPVVSGGTRLAPFTVTKEGLWETRLPAGLAGTGQLWIGGKRAIPARYPNTGFLRPVGVSEQTTNGGGFRQTVSVAPADLESLRALAADGVRPMQILVSHKWENTRRLITALDPAGGKIITEGRSVNTHAPWDATSVFTLEQHSALLDSPGEWALTPEGAVLYKPLPGENPALAGAVASRLPQLVILRGGADQKVRDIRFKGIAFLHSDWTCPPDGFNPQQAAASIEGVIQADHAQGITFEDCEIAHTGIYGMWFRRGCRDNRIERCHVHDTGGGGVRFGMMNAGTDPEDATAGNILNHSIVSDGGHVFPCATGVWIGQSGDNKVTHNEISHHSYTGVSVGWLWGYAESPGKRNTINLNHIHHIGDGLLSDLGAVYTLGPSEGTTVSGNHIHDVTALTYGGWGLYNDEGSTGILMENNVVTRTKNGSYHQHYGRENVLRNNILAFAESGQIQLTRAEDHLSFSLTGNIVLWRSGPALNGDGFKSGRVEMDRNLYWSTDGAPPDFAGMTLSAWQATGHDRGSLVADPMFRDPVKGDWALDPASPALRMGFRPIDLSESGLYGDPAWTAKGQAAPDFRTRYPARPEPE